MRALAFDPLAGVRDAALRPGRAPDLALAYADWRDAARIARRLDTGDAADREASAAHQLLAAARGRGYRGDHGPELIAWTRTRLQADRRAA